MVPRHIALGVGVLAARAAQATLSTSARVVVPAVRAVVWSPPMAPARHTAERALEGLADVGGREEARARLRLEDAGHDVLSGPLLDEVLAALVEAGVIERVFERLLDEEVIDRIIARALSSDDAERLLAASLQGEELERLVVVALESPASDRIVDRILESAEVQRVVERIANSPEVRNAIANQSLGLADVVAGEVRSRSVRGDDTAERVARSVLRRRPRHGDGPR